MSHGQTQSGWSHPELVKNLDPSLKKNSAAIHSAFDLIGSFIRLNVSCLLYV